MKHSLRTGPLRAPASLPRHRLRRFTLRRSTSGEPGSGAAQGSGQPVGLNPVRWIEVVPPLEDLQLG